MMKRFFAACGVVQLGLIAASSSAAVTYDAAADLLANEVPNGSETNPNGTWTYGGFSAAATTVTGSVGTFNAFSAAQHHDDWAAGFNGYAVGAGVAVPAIEVNTTAAGNSPCCGITPIDSHAIFVHPGPGTGAQDDVAIRWTAPTAGTVDISANFIQRHDSGQLSEVAINGVVVFAASATTGAGTSYGALTVPVAANDTIDFVVNNNPQGFGSGSTQVAATVTLTALPEPMSASVLALGVVGGAVLRRRKI